MDDLSKNTARSLGAGLTRDTTPSPHVRCFTRSGRARKGRASHGCVIWGRTKIRTQAAKTGELEWAAGENGVASKTLPRSS